MTSFAPVVIFAFRRPDHLRRTLSSLLECSGFESSPVVVYCDGPRNDTERHAVEATRRVAQEMLGERAEYVFSDVNMGLSKSVIRGVSDVLARYDRIIVVEDDLFIEPGFLLFMNDGLERYAADRAVFQVSGYQFAVPEFTPRPDALFLPFIVSWGWGTWRRAWSKFDGHSTGWERLKTDRKLRREFNLGGVYDYATMMYEQMLGLRDSWAIRWYWTVFTNHGIVLFPPATFVSNTGFDGSGTHGRGLVRNFKAVDQRRTDAIAFPEVAALVPADLAFVRKALWRMNGRLLGAIIDRIRWYRTVVRFSKQP